MPDIKSLRIGDQLPQREHCPDVAESMMYNAALWNAHRIHYDLPYATEVEGYPGLVIAGPQQGDWMTQRVMEWLGNSGQLTHLEYSNRGAAYVGDTVTAGGEISDINIDSGEVTIDIFCKNADGDVLTPGKAVVKLTGAQD